MYKDKKLKIIFAGGGTGGHLFPAIAIYEAIHKICCSNNIKNEFLFIGTKKGIEKVVLKELNLPVKFIPIRGFQRGFNLKNIFRNSVLPLRILASYIKCYIIFLWFKPDVIIGTGSYVSAPVLSIAKLMKKPYFLQEQNVTPGWVTKRYSKHAEITFTSSKETEKYIPNTFYSGIPLRSSLKPIDRNLAMQFFELDEKFETIFIFGGSQGSAAINKYWERNILKYIENLNCQFIWQTGIKNYFYLKEKFQKVKRIHLTPFIHQIEFAYSSCDLVVSRSGALTLAELSYFSKPAILIPLPTAAGNHQEINARLFERAGAARVVLQYELKTEKLYDIISELLNEPQKMAKMSKNIRKFYKNNTADLIAKKIMEHVENYVWKN